MNSKRERYSNKRITDVYKKKGCNISATCSALKIDRLTFYNWKKADEELARMLSETEEALIDNAESKLISKIIEGDITALIFFLKTKGKKRGYVEKSEYDVNVNAFERLMQELPDEEE